MIGGLLQVAGVLLIAAGYLTAANPNPWAFVAGLGAALAGGILLVKGFVHQHRSSM